jgi:hypothetical protein
MEGAHVECSGLSTERAAATRTRCAASMLNIFSASRLSSSAARLLTDSDFCTFAKDARSFAFPPLLRPCVFRASCSLPSSASGY